MILLSYPVFYLIAIAVIVVADYLFLRLMDLDGFVAPFILALIPTTFLLAVAIAVWQMAESNGSFWGFFLVAVVFLNPLLSYTATLLYETYKKPSGL